MEKIGRRISLLNNETVKVTFSNRANFRDYICPAKDILGDYATSEKVLKKLEKAFIKDIDFKETQDGEFTPDSVVEKKEAPKKKKGDLIEAVKKAADGKPFTPKEEKPKAITKEEKPKAITKEEKPKAITKEEEFYIPFEPKKDESIPEVVYSSEDPVDPKPVLEKYNSEDERMRRALISTYSVLSRVNYEEWSKDKGHLDIFQGIIKEIKESKVIFFKDGCLTDAIKDIFAKHVHVKAKS